jgi:hypothetical protein
MENERPIEKLLRGWAKKRRDEAGPMELHPVTRRQLQAEVRERYKAKQGSGQVTRQPFKPWWLNLGWAVAILAVLAVSMLVLGPRLKKPSNEMAKNEPLVAGEQRPVAAPSTPAAPGPAGELAKNAPTEADAARLETAKPSSSLSTVAPQQLADSRDRNAPVSASAAEEPAQFGVARPGNPTLTAQAQNREKDMFRDQSATSTMTRSRQAAAGNSNFSTSTDSVAPKARQSESASALALAPEREKVKSELQSQKRAEVELSAAPAIATTAAAEALSDKLTLKQNKREVQRFTQVSANVQKFFKATASPPIALLTNFEVEQTGNELRVIDQDGSVYTGSVREGLSVAASSAVDETLRQGSERRIRPSGRADADPQKLINPRSYSFTVTGTNRSLNENVVFTGAFLERFATNLAITNGLVTAVGGAAPLPKQPAVVPMQNVTISGKASIGNGQQIPVEAVPGAP